ncbi:ribonuclease domain-containing protein [soil metagenome]
MSARRPWQRWPLLGLALLLVLIATAYLVGGGPSAEPTSAPSVTQSDDGLTVVPRSELPAEADAILDRIDAGGPFGYDRDGATFENREGLLPAADPGYYREYTVDTPGASDRGARRLVTGEGGEVYYTEDHYDSFVRVDVDW